jgi:hypothetical protein
MSQKTNGKDVEETTLEDDDLFEEFAVETGVQIGIHVCTLV